VLETCIFIMGGMLLVFPELIATMLRPFGIALPFPHVLAFALAAVAVLMQWLRPAPVEQSSRS
jgi:hypothetical protein